MSDYKWIEIAPGRKRLVDVSKPRPAPAARSDIGFPMIMGSFAEPLQSMADGKFYSTKAGLERSYRADGNPQGIEYECIGDDTSRCTDFNPKPRDDKAAHEAIERTLNEYGI